MIGFFISQFFNCWFPFYFVFISTVAVSKHFEPVFQGVPKPQQNVSCSDIEIIIWWSRESRWLVYAQDVDRDALKSIIVLTESPSENGLKKQIDLWIKAIKSDCQGFPSCYTGRSGLISWQGKWGGAHWQPHLQMATH